MSESKEHNSGFAIPAAWGQPTEAGGWASGWVQLAEGNITTALRRVTPRHICCLTWQSFAGEVRASLYVLGVFLRAQQLHIESIMYLGNC